MVFDVESLWTVCGIFVFSLTGWVQGLLLQMFCTHFFLCACSSLSFYIYFSLFDMLTVGFYCAAEESIFP